MTRRARERALTLSLYAVFVVIVVVVALLADWEAITANFFLREGFTGTWRAMILVAAKNTILYTVVAFAGGATSSARSSRSAS